MFKLTKKHHMFVKPCKLYILNHAEPHRGETRHPYKERDGKRAKKRCIVAVYTAVQHFFHLTPQSPKSNHSMSVQIPGANVSRRKIELLN